MMSNFNVGRQELKAHSEVTGLPNGFTVRRGLFGTKEISERTLCCHIIHLNHDAPLALSWGSEGTFTRGICSTGDIVQLVSQGDTGSLLCNQPYNAVELSLDRHFTDKVLEKENSIFRSRSNFHDALLTDFITELYKLTLANSVEKFYSESLVVACATHLATTYGISNKKLFALKGKLSSNQLRSVIEFVRASINRSVTLEELAVCCHLSIFHFSRLFKNTLGISPYQYVLRIKIEYARSLIKHKQAIGDIAYSLGFTDSAHFCNAFKRFTGHSPLQYSSRAKIKNHRVIFPRGSGNDELKQRWEGQPQL